MLLMSEKKLENLVCAGSFTFLKVESANGQKFHNYHFRLSFDLNGYLFGFQLCFQLFAQQQKQTEGLDMWREF